jgi:hypothetical protein
MVYCWLECKHYGKTLWWLHKKINIELPYASAISLLGTYSKRIKSITSKRYLCTQVPPLAALVTIARRQQQPKCP